MVLVAAALGIGVAWIVKREVLGFQTKRLTTLMQERILPQPSVELGAVFGGIDYQKEIELMNRSSREIDIIDLSSSCGCIVPDQIGFALAPGETASIPVGFRPPPRLGSWKKKMYLSVHVDGRTVQLPIPVRASIAGIAQPLMADNLNKEQTDGAGTYLADLGLRLDDDISLEDVSAGITIKVGHERSLDGISIIKVQDPNWQRFRVKVHLGDTNGGSAVHPTVRFRPCGPVQGALEFKMQPARTIQANPRSSGTHE